MAQFTKCCNCLENAVVPIEYIFLLKKKRTEKNTSVFSMNGTVEDIPHWTDELKKGLTIQVTDCEELSPMEQEYNLMKKHHAYSRVLAPIFSRDHLSGFIGMDHFYKGISELFIHQLAFVGAHLNTARENLRMFTLLGKNLESMEKEDSEKQRKNHTLLLKRTEILL